MLLFSLPALADQQSATGKDLVSKWSSAIVTVQLVVSTSISYGGEDGGKTEEKSEATGTVIDPSGLVVMSLSATTPEEALSQVYDREDFKITSQITDLKVITADGVEIPAKIVLRDKDLDLAFIRPQKKLDKPMAAIDFTKSSKLDQFDEFIVLYRLGNSANRQVAGVLDRVQAVLQKPRPQYLVGYNSMSASLGSPVFSIDGNVCGLLVLRSQPAGVKDTSGTFGGITSGGMMYIALLADDIVEAAKQAPAE